MADTPAPSDTSSDVAKTSEAHRKAMQRVESVRALMGGTRRMREMGEKYLPKEVAEDEKPYRDRLHRSVLFGALAKTVEDMTGKIFAKPIVLGKTVPQPLQDWSENIDNAGRHLNVFARDVFFDGLQTGINFILVDMPPKVVRTDGAPATLADEIAAGHRPYLVHVKIENLIGWRSTVVDGVETLTMVRILECVTEQDGEFSEKSVEQIRVLEPGKWRIYRKVPGSQTDEWSLYSEGDSNLQKLTLVPVYFRRTDFMCGVPPLEKLAELNIAHWQSSSDQANIVHVARVPILFGAGFNGDDKLIIGAGTMSTASNPLAKLTYVEHTGKAIESGQTQLDKLEYQMQVMGLTLITPQPGGQSATGAILDSDKENSPLAMMATSLQDGLEMAFGFMAEYAGIAPTKSEAGNGDGKQAGGEITINKDFGATAGRTDLQQLVATFSAGAISKETLWEEMQRRNFLSDSFDPDVETERLETEHASLLPANPLGNRVSPIIPDDNTGEPGIGDNVAP